MRKELLINQAADKLEACESVPSAIRIETKCSVKLTAGSNDPDERLRQVIEEFTDAWEMVKLHSEDKQFVLGCEFSSLFVSYKAKDFFEYQGKLLSHLLFPIQNAVSLREKDSYSTEDHLQIVGICERLIKYFFTGDDSCILKVMHQMGIKSSLKIYGIPYFPPTMVDLKNGTLNYIMFGATKTSLTLPADGHNSAIQKEFSKKLMQIMKHIASCEGKNREEQRTSINEIVFDLVELTLAELQFHMITTAEKSGEMKNLQSTFYRQCGQNEYVFTQLSLMVKYKELGAKQNKKSRDIMDLVYKLFPTNMNLQKDRIRCFKFSCVWMKILSDEFAHCSIQDLHRLIQQRFIKLNLKWLFNVFTARLNTKNVILLEHDPLGISSNQVTRVVSQVTNIDSFNRISLIQRAELTENLNLTARLPDLHNGFEDIFDQVFELDDLTALSKIEDMNLFLNSIVEKSKSIDFIQPEKLPVKLADVNINNDRKLYRAMICAILHGKWYKSLEEYRRIYSQKQSSIPLDKHSGSPVQKACVFFITFLCGMHNVNWKTQVSNRSYERLKSGPKALKTFGLITLSRNKSAPNADIKVLECSQSFAELKHIISSSTSSELRKIFWKRLSPAYPT